MQDREDEHAYDRVKDPAPASAEQRPADDDGGDARELHARARVDDSRFEAGGTHRPSQAEETACEHEQEHLVAVDLDAREACHILAAADDIRVAAESRVALD